MTPIKIKFDFTFEIYKQSLKLHRKHAIWPLIYWIVCFWFFPAMAAIDLSVWAYLTATQRPGDAGTALTLGIVFSIWFCMAILAVWYRNRKFYKTTFPSGSSSRVVEVEVGDVGVAISIASSFSTQLAWASVARSVEGESLFLIYMNKSRFIPVPRAALTEEELDSLKSYLQAHSGGH